MTDPFVLSEAHRAMSKNLAQQIIQAFDEAPPFIGIATIIAVTGSVCFNEAGGDMDRAKHRAMSIAAGVMDVIDKLHQSDQGNGPLEDV